VDFRWKFIEQVLKGRNSGVKVFEYLRASYCTKRYCKRWRRLSERIQTSGATRRLWGTGAVRLKSQTLAASASLRVRLGKGQKGVRIKARSRGLGRPGRRGICISLKNFDAEGWWVFYKTWHRSVKSFVGKGGSI
jgi:hypothetical protein